MNCSLTGPPPVTFRGSCRGADEELLAVASVAFRDVAFRDVCNTSGVI